MHVKHFQELVLCCTITLCAIPQVQNDVGLSAEPVTRTLKVIEDCRPGQITCDSGLCADALNNCQVRVNQLPLAELSEANLVLKEVAGAWWRRIEKERGQPDVGSKTTLSNKINVLNVRPAAPVRVLAPKQKSIYKYVGTGGCKKHNFWNTPVHPFKNYIFGILRLKPIDWYMHGTDPRRGGVVGG